MPLITVEKRGGKKVLTSRFPSSFAIVSEPLVRRERLRFNHWLFLGENRLSALSPECQKNADGSLQEISLFTVAIHLNRLKPTIQQAKSLFSYFCVVTQDRNK